MLIAVLVAVFSICAIVVTRYYAVKTRLTEKSIDEAIARRLRASPVMEEVRDLRELNGVMRNLLVDFLESEDIRPSTANEHVSPQDRKRLFQMREDRRREIYAEALILLRHTRTSRDKTSVN
jgi:hypothetical protein